MASLNLPLRPSVGTLDHSEGESGTLGSVRVMAKSIPNDIFQYSLLSAHEAGLRDGGPPVAFLTNHGNHGIGIFESEEDDEANQTRKSGNDLLQIEGITYSIDDNGVAARAEHDDQAPFVMVTIFQPQQKHSIPTGTSRSRVAELFDRTKNTPIPYRLTGAFKYISTRQQTYWDVEGTIFGFYVPAWQTHISGKGLQSCFIAHDKRAGGKVNDFETGSSVVLEWAKCGRFHLGFPQDEEYDQLRLNAKAG